MRIRVESRVRATAIDADAVRQAAVYVLRRERRPEGSELGVLFAGERLMRRLNRRYRGVDRGTDVLAFPLEESGPRGRPRLLGDVVISPRRAQAFARLAGTPCGEELLLYLVHGILHLCGYDDETAGARERMERRQRMLVGEIVRKGLWSATG